MRTATACRTRDCSAPDTADHATLHRASDGDLLTAFASLTHRIHASDTARVAELDRTAELREQRDLVRAEILRRMGGAR